MRITLLECDECKEQKRLGQAKGWLRIPVVEEMNNRKQWKKLYAGEINICDTKECRRAFLEKLVL